MPDKRQRQSAPVTITLPNDLIGELERYSAQYRFKNKSGFVADALHFYIKHIETNKPPAPPKPDA